MKKIAIFVLFSFITLVLAGCAEMRKATKPSQQEVDAASAAVRGCLESKVALVDDGTSDAMTIAQSLTSLCRNEFHEFAYIHIKNENPHVQQMFYDKIERSKDNLNTALVYVLKYRISQKEDQKGQGR